LTQHYQREGKNWCCSFFTTIPKMACRGRSVAVSTKQLDCSCWILSDENTSCMTHHRVLHCVSFKPFTDGNQGWNVQTSFQTAPSHDYAPNSRSRSDHPNNNGTESRLLSVCSETGARTEPRSVEAASSSDEGRGGGGHSRWTRQPQQNATLFGRLLPSRSPTDAILFLYCSGARLWIARSGRSRERVRSVTGSGRSSVGSELEQPLTTHNAVPDEESNSSYCTVTRQCPTERVQLFRADRYTTPAACNSRYRDGKKCTGVLLLPGSTMSRYYHPCTTTTLNKPTPSTADRDAGNTSPIRHIPRMEHPTHPTHGAPSTKQKPNTNNKHTTIQQARRHNTGTQCHGQSEKTESSEPSKRLDGRQKNKWHNSKKGTHRAQTENHD